MVTPFRWTNQEMFPPRAEIFPLRPLRRVRLHTLDLYTYIGNCVRYANSLWRSCLSSQLFVKHFVSSLVYARLSVAGKFSLSFGFNLWLAELPISNQSANAKYIHLSSNFYRSCDWWIKSCKSRVSHLYNVKYKWKWWKCLTTTLLIVLLCFELK